VQVDCKAKQITELNDALQKAIHEVKNERRHTGDVEQMLAREKKLAANFREDLEFAKVQLSEDKDKLANALKQNAVINAQVDGVAALG
jgi:hypothetical protein